MNLYSHNDIATSMNLNSHNETATSEDNAKKHAQQPLIKQTNPYILAHAHSPHRLIVSNTYETNPCTHHTN